MTTVAPASASNYGHERSSSSAGITAPSALTTPAAINLSADLPSSSPFSGTTLQETEEDELSAFVQAIDERVPLGSLGSRSKGIRRSLRDGGWGSGVDVQQPENSRQREGSDNTVRQDSSSPVPSKSPLSPSPSTSPLNPLPARLPSQTSNISTSRQSPSQLSRSRNVSLPMPDSRAVRIPQSRAAIDAELKRMTDEFITSLSTLNFNAGISTGAAGVIRRRTASGLSSSRGSGSPSPGQSGMSALSGAIGLARRVSLAGGSPSGSIGSSSPSGSALASGQASGAGSPLARSPPKGGYRPLYPPQPSSSSSPLNSSSASPTNLRTLNPHIYQYSSAPMSHPYHPIPSHPHPHSSTQPHQGSPLRSAIPLDEESSSSSPAERKGEGGVDSGSSELNSGYGLGLGVAGNVPSPGMRGNTSASPALSRPAASAEGTGGQAPLQRGFSVHRILTRANTSEEVIGRLEVDDVGGGGDGDNRTTTERSEPRSFSRDQVVYPFPRSNDRGGIDEGGKRGNGYRIV